MSLDTRFADACVKAKTFTKLPTQSELLQLYALYKQALEGDNKTSKPSNVFDLKGRAKWDSWNDIKGKSQDAAKEEYITLVEKLSLSYL